MLLNHYLLIPYTRISQRRKSKAIAINTWERKRSSWYCWVPGAGGTAPAPQLLKVVNIPKGNAPMPKWNWNPPPSPNPNPGINPLWGSGSVRWPGGRGGSLSLGSCWLPDPLPYRGITFSLDIAALQTGHVWLFGRVSSHWCKQGQQKRCPHMEMTASFAVSRHILHSKFELSVASSPLPSAPPEALLLLSLRLSLVLLGPAVAILAGLLKLALTGKFWCSLLM